LNFVNFLSIKYVYEIINSHADVDAADSERCFVFCVRLVARSLEIDQLHSEKQSVEQQLTEFRMKAAETDNHSAEALNKLRDSFQMVEKAIAERDEVMHYHWRVCLTSFLQRQCK
jgi:hypothetical protein